MSDSQRRQRDDLLAVLGAVPERVSDLVALIPPPSLDYRHAPALPTLRELIGHFWAAGAAVDAVLRRALVGGRYELSVREAIDPNAQVDSSLPPSELLADLARVRRRTVDFLRGLAAQEWKRRLTDPTFGDLDLYQVCEMAVQHELGHLGQVRNLITLLPDPFTQLAQPAG
jgi:hypothetical protein